MKIFVLDDSEPALKFLVNVIAEVKQGAEIFPFTKPSEFLEFAKSNSCDIAFLDIQMWGMNGLEVAKELKNYSPKTNIIFVTAHSEYASNAFSLYASGYLLKPITKEAVEKEIENLRYPLNQKNTAKIYVQTFGNFEVFSYGTPIKFSYSKTKELLAYLIDRNGASVNMNELCAVLWEEKGDTVNLKAYLRKLISDLIKTLEKADASDIIIKRYNSIAIMPGKILCESYGFLKGDPECINSYSGQYMAQYSWAEVTAGFIEKIHLNK
jgi:two-component SAPR family response regulator